MEYRIGQGVDIHTFVHGRPLVLGGVTIPFEYGLKGHSDADVLVHAIMDALLGAAGLFDIGHHFPDTDPAFKDADSIVLLERVREIIRRDGWRVVNCDASLVAEVPRVGGYIPQMKERIASALDVEPERVGVKATTAERLGSLGRREGIVAFAVAMLERKEVMSESVSN
jgi:2-C-methyl-D-erythritol 2,4-cyclodiphosphate synthase